MHIVFFAYGAADATESQNPIISCLIGIKTGFTSLVPAYADCAGKDALNRCSSSSSNWSRGFSG